MCLSILSSRHGATHSHLLSVRPPATLFLHAALDLYLLAQRNKNRSLYVASHCEVFSRNLRLSDYLSNAATSKVGGCDASKRSAIEVRTRARTVMENPAKQRAPASSEIVKLIRKLRWAGLEEKAEQLEKELDRHTVTDTVVSIQNETD